LATQEISVSVNLSQSDQAAVYSSILPRFQPDRNGRYRGPATHRGGDNRTSLTIDLAKGLWFDHATGSGGDAIAFVQIALNTNFKSACKAVSEVLGRNILSDSLAPSRPRYSEQVLANAEFFRIGLSWRVEHALVTLKECMWRDANVEDANVENAIRSLTQQLSSTLGWNAYEAAAAYIGMSRLDSQLVDACIAEATKAQTDVAALIVAIATAEAAAA
jgi:hypothetical protein